MRINNKSPLDNKLQDSKPTQRTPIKYIQDSFTNKNQVYLKNKQNVKSGLPPIKNKIDHQQKIKQNNKNVSYKILDYRNARFQGFIKNIQTKPMTNNNKDKIINKQQINQKHGKYGIIIDDNFNFILTEFHRNCLNKKTVLINRKKNFMYGQWKAILAQQNHQKYLKKQKVQQKQQNQIIQNKKPTSRPLGVHVIKIQHYFFIVKFNIQNGQLQMQKNKLQKQLQPKNRNEQVLIIFNEIQFSILVLKGKIQIMSTHIRCSKSFPLKVVQYIPLGLIKQNKNQPNLNNLMQILKFYGKKYNINLDYHQLSISTYLKSIADEIGKEHKINLQIKQNINKKQNKCFKSNKQNNNNSFEQKNEQIEEKQNNLITQNNQINKQTIKNQNNPSKNLYKKVKIQQKSFQQYQNLTPELIIFQEIKKNNDKNTLKYSKIPEIDIKVHKSYYFGFKEGLGIKFSQLLNFDQNQRQYSNNSPPFGQTQFKLKSMGIHNRFNNPSDIGIIYYPNNCIQQGNFQIKQTLTYQNYIFRPQNKLQGIYKKFHRKQQNFITQYFDCSQQFSLLDKFEKFLEQHVLFIFKQCIRQNGKLFVNTFQKQINSELKYQPKQKIEKQKVNIAKSKKYELQIVRKKSKSFQSPKSQKNTSRNKSKALTPKTKQQPLKALKQKNTELKQKIKKVKYQIQYNGQGQKLTKNEQKQKQLSKIKKYLNQTQKKDKSLTPRKSSFMNAHDKVPKKSYIKKQRIRTPSPSKSKSFSPTKSPSPKKQKKIEKVQERISNEKNLKSQNVLLVQQAIHRINKHIKYKQKYEDGLLFNINHAKSRQENKSKQIILNKYNCRQRSYTDQEIDQVLQKHPIYYRQRQLNNPKCQNVMKQKKQRNKQKYRNYIYSNNQSKMQYNKDQNLKQYQQKQVQDQIKAQILGITKQDFQNRQIRVKKVQQYLNQNLLPINKQISNKQESFVTFDLNKQNSRNNQISFNLNVSQKKSIIDDYSNYNKSSQQQQTLMNILEFSRAEQQEGLIEKRLRILRQYQQLQLKNNKNKNKIQQNIIDQRHNKSIQKMISNFQDERFNNYSHKSIKQHKYQLNVNNFPIYEQKQKSRLSQNSPHKYEFTEKVITKSGLHRKSMLQDLNPRIPQRQDNNLNERVSLQGDIYQNEQDMKPLTKLYGKLSIQSYQKLKIPLNISYSNLKVQNPARTSQKKYQYYFYK